MRTFTSPVVDIVRFVSTAPVPYIVTELNLTYPALFTLEDKVTVVPFIELTDNVFPFKDLVPAEQDTLLRLKLLPLCEMLKSTLSIFTLLSFEVIVIVLLFASFHPAPAASVAFKLK